MRKVILTSLFASAVLLFTTTTVSAQSKTKKKEVIEVKAVSTPNATVAGLARPTQSKNKPAAKSRGDVYGANYSDIVIDNWTGYLIDVYVDGSYRGSISPWDKRVTWAIPGNTTLYAKAVFDDGSYLYWGPSVTKTGYQYTWKLNK